MLISAFNHTIGIWIHALEHYDFNRLCMKPSPTSWSLGQVYMHLIDDTRFYIGQMRICLSSNDHATDDASDFAKTMLLQNDFPDEALKGAPSNDFLPQPESKEQLTAELIKLKTDMNEMATLISKSQFHGKSKHPGFNYFSANEWLQFAEMHLRHHLRQKKRIDAFLTEK